MKIILLRKSRHLPEVKSQVQYGYYLGYLKFLPVLCVSQTLKLLMGFALASKYVTAARKALCERDQVLAVLVVAVSVLGRTAYKICERGMGSADWGTSLVFYPPESTVRSLYLQKDQVLSMELLRWMQGKIDPFSYWFKHSSEITTTNCTAKPKKLYLENLISHFPRITVPVTFRPRSNREEWHHTGGLSDATADRNWWLPGVHAYVYIQITAASGPKATLSALHQQTTRCVSKGVLY